MHFQPGKQLTPRNGIIFFVLLVFIGALYTINWSFVTTEPATVIDIKTINYTQHSKTSSGSGKRSTIKKYLIHTDKGTFEDTTDFLRGKRNINYYNTIEQGETYVFTVSGIHIPFINSYPNVIDVKEIIQTTSPQNETE